MGILMFNLRAPNLSTNNIPIHFANDLLNEFARFVYVRVARAHITRNLRPFTKIIVLLDNSN